jgi:FkbM family methyltransferase
MTYRIPGKYLFKLVELKNRFWKGYGNLYYSQGGEDIIINSIFRKKRDGFFIDIGAYHPKHYSNTYLLSKKGWHGINVDPNPESIRLFEKYRPQDINLRLGIARNRTEADYYIFNQQSCNTFSPEQKDKMLKKSFIELIGQEKVLCLPLREVLQTHLPSEVTKIDLMNIDVEGMDIEVLHSNDWKKHRPTVVCIEDANFSLDTPEKSQVYSFLQGQGYQLHGLTGLSLILTDTRV